MKEGLEDIGPVVQDEAEECTCSAPGVTVVGGWWLAR